ncbi:MAG: hypothetical protein KatS3mg111_2890 [Pirellulaceae bacterium]|nr:MAG: hypothetical protein KatS3mg111_2890 [Pirellulaceae bacterium]
MIGACWCRRLGRLAVDDQGVTSVEYAVIIALIVAVVIGGVQALTNATRDSFDSSGAVLFQ